MTEPKSIATEVEEVVQGIFHWRIHDDRINFVSAAHAVRAPEGTILIDPLPLAPDSLAALGPVAAICLTCGSHQRSAWRLRRELRAAVHAPGLSREIEEEPDERYGDGDVLPGGLRAIFTPGAGTTQHTLLLEEPSVAFVPDLLLFPPSGKLEVLEANWMYDVDAGRRSLEKLLELPFSVLCLGHGPPIIDDPRTSVAAAFEAWTKATATSESAQGGD